MVFSSEKAKVLLLLAIACSIFLVNLNGWDLWNPDEPRYAQVAREMRVTGEWFLPHLNSEVYPDKPPLFFWLIALFSYLTGGVTEVSARMPSALASVGSVLLTFFLGKRLFGARGGLLAGIVLMTSTEFFWLGRRANIDMTLTLFVTLAITFFYLGLQKNDKPRVFYFLPYVFMGLGVLTKGPIGFLLPFLSIMSYLLATGNLKEWRKLEIPWGMLLFVGIVLAWLIPACLKGGEAYTREILLQQNVERFADTWAHKQPFYYYLYIFPSGFVPWVLLLPGALMWGFSRSQRGHRDVFLFPLCWFLLIFVFFSISTGKRELYLLPLYPAASLMVGGFISRITLPQRQMNIPFKTLIIPLYLMGGGFLVGGLGACAFPFFKTPLSGMVPFFPHVVFLAMVFILGGYLIIHTARKRQIVGSFAGVTMILLISYYGAIGVILPKMNYFKSPRPLSESIVRHLPEGKELVSYGLKVAPFNFYTGLNKITEIPTLEELQKSFTAPSTGLVLLKEKDAKVLQEKNLMPSDFHIVDTSTIGRTRYILLARTAA